MNRALLTVTAVVVGLSLLLVVAAAALGGYRSSRARAATQVSAGSEPRTVVASVTYSDGRPVPDAKVVVMTSSGTSSARTDSDGLGEVYVGEPDIDWIKINGVKAYVPRNAYAPGSSLRMRVTVSEPWVFKLTSGGIWYARAIRYSPRAALLLPLSLVVLLPAVALIVHARRGRDSPGAT